MKDKHVWYTNFGGGFLVKKIYELQIEVETWYEGTYVAKHLGSR
jgi:hypothetical protein